MGDAHVVGDGSEDVVKTYAVKAIFGPTVQGEGSLVGAVTLFLRLAGCNVWDGRPETKAASGCPYCDTEFRGGERLTADEVVARLKELAPGGLVTVSGGEPLLQLDRDLALVIKGAGFLIAIETNGTRALPLTVAVHVDHVTMSPKVQPSEIALGACDDIKVLFPHPNPAITPEAFDSFPARSRYLQPVNGVGDVDPVNVARTLDKLYSLNARTPDRPWRLSVQLHKFLGVA